LIDLHTVHRSASALLVPHPTPTLTLIPVLHQSPTDVYAEFLNGDGQLNA